MNSNETVTTDTKLQEPFVADNPAHTRLTVKHGALFLVTNEQGMMPGDSRAGYGLYRDDTRFLNRWQFNINGAPLRLLRASVAEGFAGKFVYGNPNLRDIPEQTLLVQQDIVIVEGRLRVRLTVTNFGVADVPARLNIGFGADFYDIFEVRGATRAQRGTQSASVVGGKSRVVRYSYVGLDGVEMATRVSFSSETPISLTENVASLNLSLKHGKEHSAVVDVCIESVSTDAVRLTMPTFEADAALARSQYEAWLTAGATITTGDQIFNELLERSYRDLYILRQPSPRGNCLAAGIPWFTVAFGRDQCIAGMQTVALLPELAREIVEMLAAYQGTIDDDYTAQKIGKIMHELRIGEMARLKEIPFIPYYGTADATQLWLMLLVRVYEWTGDLKFVRRLWPKVKLALSYLDREVRATTGGYVTYGGKPGAALTNQGWKDSHDSIMYSDGKQAKGPIALCEVQGYLYSAWSGLSKLALALGYRRQSRTLDRQAAALKERFQRDFWMPEKNFVALALDGDGRQCDVVSSNPGHLLGTGILDSDKAHAVAMRLVGTDMFCGWGIRTLSSDEAAYNPMSYHNGSVWPHDNAEAVYNCTRIGRMREAHEVLLGMYHVARNEPGLRLPELFSGFGPYEFDGHVSYPVSCSPQAWAAGSMFHMLVACLGLHPDAANRELRILGASVPRWLGTVSVTGLRVGQCNVDLEFVSTMDGGTTCRVLRKSGELRVTVVA